MREHLTDDPCPTCLAFYCEHGMRTECIQRIPEGARAPLNLHGEKICWDCDTATTLTRLGNALTWEMARTAAANDRQEQIRMPGAPIGLAHKNLLKKNAEGDFEDHMRWIKEVLLPLLEEGDAA